MILKSVSLCLIFCCIYFVTRECSSYHNQFATVYFCLGIHLLSKSTHMKGLFFGLLYAIRAFNQLQASLNISAVSIFLKEGIDTCNEHFSLMNIGIAILLLLIFTVVSHRYQYHKRDNICNIYQYAENYYSNYGTLN